MTNPALSPAIAFGDDLHSPYPSLAKALISGIARAEGGYFLSIKADGREVITPWEQSLALAFSMLATLKREGAVRGAAMVLRLQEAEEIVTCIHAGILGGFVILPMTARKEQPLPPAITAIFPQIIDIDDTAFQRLSRGDAAAPCEPASGKPGDLRFGIPTSGTTGAPRLVGLSDAAALARWWPRIPQAGKARGFLSWTSFDHVMGIGLAMPDLPVKVHLDTTRFVSDPLTWLDALASSGATHATTTNFGLDRLVSALGRAPERSWNLSHVQRIGIGAETVSRTTVEAALHALIPFGLRDDALIAGYGLSECGPVVGGGTSITFADQPYHEPQELDGPTAGHALRITDAEGALLPEGMIGAIEVRGPTMTSGYIGDPEANSRLFTADHWLRTGDLGRLRRGKLTVTGREKELIFVNAKKYTCQEIELQLRAVTGYREIYAAPLPHNAGLSKGAPCGIFVVCDTCPDPDALARDIARTMARAFRFVPARVSLLKPDDVPRTALGKIRRLHLPSLPCPNIAYQSRHKDALSEDFGPIRAIWRDVLKLEGDIDPDEDFFLLGGDSLMAIELAAEIERSYAKRVNLQDFPETLSLRILSEHLSGHNSDSPRPLAPWHEKMQNLIEFWPGKPGLDAGLVRRLGSGQPIADAVNLFWCAQTAGEAESLEEALSDAVNCFALRSGAYLFHYETAQSQAAAAHYAHEIQKLAPCGPLVLGGNCQGATMMAEVIPILRKAGREITLFIIADTDLLRLSKDQAFDMPVSLIAMSGSRFNPQRWFRDPVIGLRKIAPKGLMFRILPGRYAETWVKPSHLAVGKLISEAISWCKTAGTVDLPVPLPLTSGFYNRKITTPHENLILIAGQDYDLQLELTNTGNIPWMPYAQSGLAVGNHWLTTTGEILLWSDGHLPLPSPLLPQETITTTLRIRAPHNPGPALLEVDLAEQGMRWFVEVNAPPLQIPVLVQAPPKPAPWWRALLNRIRTRLEKPRSNRNPN